MYAHLMALHTQTDLSVCAAGLTRHSTIWFLPKMAMQVSERGGAAGWQEGGGAVITQIKPFSEILFQRFIVN